MSPMTSPLHLKVVATRKKSWRLDGRMDRQRDWLGVSKHQVYLIPYAGRNAILALGVA